MKRFLMFIGVWLLMITGMLLASAVSVYLFSWLFFNLNPVETYNAIGEWAGTIRWSVGVWAIAMFLKSNNIVVVPIPFAATLDVEEIEDPPAHE